MAKKISEKNELSFEASLERLEAIVEVMESGEMPLEQIIEQYEEGMKYLTTCDKKLTEAEKRVKQLTAEGETDFERAVSGNGSPC